MRRRLSSLALLVGSCGLIAGCGGSGSASGSASSSSGAAAAPTVASSSAASTSTSPVSSASVSTATSAASSTVTTVVNSAGGVEAPSSGLSSAAAAEAIAACKADAGRSTLPADLRAKYESLCTQAVSGDRSGLLAAGAQLCREIVRQTVPAAAQAGALKSCPKL